MAFKHRHLILLSVILASTYALSSTTSFCSDLISKGDINTPCFLEPPTHNPALIRTSSQSLILPCHVARSKHSTVEWWYTDIQNTINIKIYPVFPAVRPTVLRFITSTSPFSKNSNETDIVDASVLLRSVNVDDSGVYRCVIRPWTPSITNNMDFDMIRDDPTAPTLSYHVELTAPRLCQASPGALPCFSSMRTSSPTVIDAFQTAFLQCVVTNYNRPTSVFWVVGNASANSILITDYLATNKHGGDRLRRVFPLSPFDYSIEVSVNRDIHQRSYSCVIDGPTGAETTLFTYIIRTINLEPLPMPTTTTTMHKNLTLTTLAPNSTVTTTTTPPPPQVLVAHDALSSKEVEDLRHRGHHEKEHSDNEDVSVEDRLQHMESDKSVQKAIDADISVRK